MKRLLLALALIFATLSPSTPVDASGSNTVFLSIRGRDFVFTKAAADEFFNNSKLYNYLEFSQDRQVIVARVNSYIFRTAYYWTNWGCDLNLSFEGYESLTFKYYPALDAMLSITEDQDIVVLLPEVSSVKPN